ncbi:MAG: CAP domain-containing protein [Bacteroidales bacterium]|nr:CAP domain-containing protein [Bacteroidales bacterium]MBN2756769.1 CAP domain-containing protein [Bacteroidales bacterium]
MQKVLLSISLFTVFFLFSCEEEENQISSQTTFDKEIFNLINNHRLEIGLEAFEYSEVIWEQANQHSKDMAEGIVDFGHDGFSERIDNIQQEIGGSSAAENVAMGYSTAESVVNGWLSSDEHKQNIEGNYTHSAISAVKNNSGVYYYTQIFINLNK